MYLLFLHTKDSEDRRLKTGSNTVSSGRRGKIRGNTLPVEVALELFLRNVTGQPASWNAANPIASWYKAEMRTQDKLELQFGSISLRGKLNWASLPSITSVLLIHDNQLEGSFLCNELPSGLQVIWANGNKFSGPLDIENLPVAMAVCYFGNNKFIGELNLRNLPPRLRELHLEFNSFEGNIDLSTLPGLLQRIDLSWNKLSGELDVSHLTDAMLHLNVYNNAFQGVIPDPPPKCVQLHKKFQVPNIPFVMRDQL